MAGIQENDDYMHVSRITFHQFIYNYIILRSILRNHVEIHSLTMGERYLFGCCVMQPGQSSGGDGRRRNHCGCIKT